MKIFLVGGAVRDTLLHLAVHDRDWVVVGATTEQLLALGYQQVGKKFPVFLHPKTREEYALARTERKSGAGHTGFSFHAAPDVTLEQDLSRRDLTINAMAQTMEGKLLDPFNGKADLNNRILRHVSPAFSDDPLRVLRVARFAARFAHLGFSIATETLSLVTEMVASGELNTLPPERVWLETEKAMATHNPEIYFKLLKKCDALVLLFPEIDRLINTDLTEKKALNSHFGSLDTLATATQLTNDIGIRFSAFCQRLDKPSASQLCLRLRVPNWVRDLVLLAIEFCPLIPDIQQLPAANLLTFFYQIDAWRKPERLTQITSINEANHHNPKDKKDHYSSAEYLQLAFTVANSVKAKSIVDEGLTGIDIHHKLYQYRLEKLIHWKK